MPAERAAFGWCTRHEIAYKRDLDAYCPQCQLTGSDAEQIDWDPEGETQVVVKRGAPVKASGKPAAARS